jgi:hypothetical protein
MLLCTSTSLQVDLAILIVVYLGAQKNLMERALKLFTTLEGILFHKANKRNAGW